MASPRPHRQRRRREIERWLGDCGLLHRPRRVSSVAAEEESFPRRLCHGLERGGLAAGSARLFHLFGRYLSTRADLFPARQCFELARLSGVSSPTPLSEVRRVLSDELEARPEELFTALVEEPFAVRPLTQSHRARLSDGRGVVVTIAHPGVRSELESDLGMLSLLAPALGEASFEEVMNDFRRTALADCDAQAAALEALGVGLVDSGGVVVPEVCTSLTTSRLLVLEDVGGSRPGLGGGGGTGLGHRIARLWLEQAVRSGTVPVVAEVRVLEDGRLAVVGGEISHLPAALQTLVWEYLTACARQQPEEACRCLLRELDPGCTDVAGSALCLGMRQAVPFRDGCWSERGDGLAELLLLHWRIAHGCGLGPRSHLRAFFRGLTWVARLGRELEPRADPLREALDELSWRVSGQALRVSLDPRRVGESLYEGVESLFEIPAKLDRLLDLATCDQGVWRLRVSNSPAGRRRQSSTATVISLGLVMASIVLFSTQLDARGLQAEWAQDVAAIAFLLCGAWVLRASAIRRS